jgi:hypothetical protein
MAATPPPHPTPFQVSPPPVPGFTAEGVRLRTWNVARLDSEQSRAAPSRSKSSARGGRNFLQSLSCRRLQQPTPSPISQAASQRRCHGDSITATVSRWRLGAVSVAGAGRDDIERRFSSGIGPRAGRRTPIQSVTPAAPGVTDWMAVARPLQTSESPNQ